MATLLPALPLRGPRVALRALVPADRDALFAALSDPEAMRFWSAPPLRSPAQADPLVASALSDPSAEARLGIAEGTALVGFVSLHRVSWTDRRAEVGYLLARPAWGRGLATEAVSLLVEHAFRGAGLERLEADTDPRNLRSVRLLERLGFVREGLLRERWIVGGRRQDTALYGLLAREWRG